MAHLLLSQEVTITTRGDKEYVGVISPPPHGMSLEERAKVKNVEDIFVNIGVNDADAVKALGIRVGDTVTPPYPVQSA